MIDPLFAVLVKVACQKILACFERIAELFGNLFRVDGVAERKQSVEEHFLILGRALRQVFHLMQFKGLHVFSEKPLFRIQASDLHVSLVRKIRNQREHILCVGRTV